MTQTVVKYIEKLLSVSYAVEGVKERMDGALVGRDGEEHINHFCENAYDWVCSTWLL